MNNNAINTIEFDKILQKLSNHAISENAKEKLLALKPFLSERECKAKQHETTQAVKILNAIGTAPLAAMKELDKILTLANKGNMLIPEQLVSVSTFISSCRRMKSYLKKAQALGVEIASYGGSIDELSTLYEEIDKSIRGSIIDSNASAQLRQIRRKIENTNSSIKAKLETILRSKKEWFADSYVSTRSGRFVLPVKKEYKNQISGSVIDTSGTGSTYFIEPTSVRRLQDELSLLQIDEDNEIRRILYTLTALVDENMMALKINVDCMQTLDFIFAKAKLSIEMKAVAANISTKRKIKIVAGRHPLLKQSDCVALDFEIGGDVNGVIITGPNTGGKTVALKTVGLLSIMAQSGLHVPACEGSEFTMNVNVLADIGDGQSITENLSTFSAHITNIINVLNNATGESLVLLDELGSGTDPAEGMGIAVAVLNELKERGCLFVATTHYPEIKDFAKNTSGLINARMEFDRESLQPLYKLQIGEAGDSCALYIAKRLGFPEKLLKRAHQAAYGSNAANEMELNQAEEEKRPIISSKIQKEEVKKEKPLRSQTFNVGDSVMVFPKKQVGIVYKRANEKGELVVQIKGQKQLINHKKIKLLTSASELYPEDYDFSIIFDSVENRKAHHDMSRKHDPSLIIEHKPEGY